MPGHVAGAASIGTGDFNRGTAAPLTTTSGALHIHAVGRCYFISSIFCTEW